MDQVVARFQKAVNCVDSSLHEVTAPDAWSRPTPCSEWDVRALVQHVVNELAWIPPLVAGKTIADVGSELDGDLLGNDPLGAFHHHCRAAHAAIEEPGALDGTVHLSYGDETALGYVEQVTGDVLIHSWDLARGLGVDDELPEDLVAWASQWGDQIAPMIEGSGLFAPPVDVPADADAQTALLARFGRAR
jgi:uncharacterized protein (TIGR03086 family)